jgi:transcriptional regulator with PAS, ATPase and Fis domain
VIIGVSPGIKRALTLAERYARTRLPILLVGATGTGKEIFATHVHCLSGRRGPMVDVNCGALPRDMVESLLFGHRRGAFTGAVESTEGYIAKAHGGTLFLDELTSLAPDAQVKLLRVLETAQVEPLGAGLKRDVDLRVVAAAQDDLGTALGEGRLRRDLYQRLAGVVIELPRLVQRQEDLMPLAQHFAARDRRIVEPGVEAVIHGYSWPGNVRELQLAIERAGHLVENGTLSAPAVAEAIRLGAPSPRTPDEAPDRAERRAYLLAVGTKAGWDLGLMSAALGVKRTQVYERLRAAGLTLRTGRKESTSGERPADVPDESGSSAASGFVTR